MTVKGLNHKPRGWTVLVLVGLLLAIALSVTVRVSQAVATAPPWVQRRASPSWVPRR